MASDPNIRVHKARLQDAEDIFNLVNSLSGDRHPLAPFVC